MDFQISLNSYWILQTLFRDCIHAILLPERISHLNKTEINLNIFPGPCRVVLTEIIFIIEIEVSLEPLYKLKVILISTLTQFLDIDVLLNFAFSECLLQYLVIIYKFPLVSSTPIHTLHSHLTRIHSVYQVTVNSASTQLLYLYDLQVQRRVHPVNQIRLRNEEGPLHHSYTLFFRIHNINIVTIMKWLVMLILLTYCRCQRDQKFYYQADDLIQIQNNSSLEISFSLFTGADQYLSEASLFTTLNFTQNSSTTSPYNLLYFNYGNLQGQQCYQNWTITGSLYDTATCSLINSQIKTESLPGCMNYTGCQKDYICLTLYLQKQQYRQSIIVLQNPSLSNPLEITTNIKIQLSSKNTWFFWGVGLTCLLLIALVIYTGIVFYWSLKYKKTKKMFEQFKLTQQSQISKAD